MSSLNTLHPRGLFDQPPPPPQSRATRNPTLLFSWWCTIFSAVIIIIRLCGRKTRSNRLFREDWIMMASLVPLFIRMAFIHVVLLWGTNNVQTVGIHYTPEDIAHREIGARLVLAARIFYAAFIWTCKLTISEFLKRITIRIWRKSYEWMLRGIRVFLGITFCLVVIETLSECQPFDHYWQVIPDPGAKCRTGYANLITMGTCDMITDILLVAFPIPIIVRSGQTWRRKLQLSSLFSLSIILIAITAARVPLVIEHLGRQQYRTVWASCEIIAATGVANAVIIGSFLRDKGTKKNKYRSNSVSDSLERTSTRRPTLAQLHDTGSEENLFRFLGIRMPDHLQEEAEDGPRLAPPALPATSTPMRTLNRTQEARENNHSSDSDDSLNKSHAYQPVAAATPISPSTQTANFFDVGGLLEDNPRSNSRTRHIPSTLSAHNNNTTTQDFATPSPGQSRRGSHAFLQDVGGLTTPSTGSRSTNGSSNHHFSRPHRPSAPAGVLGPMLERRETQQSLQDAGGLLLSDDDLITQEAPSSSSSSNNNFHTSGGRDNNHTTSLIRALSDGPPADYRPPRHQAARPTRQRQSPTIADVGDLLSGSHEPDASAAALERRLAGAEGRRTEVPRIPPPPPSSAQPGSGEDGQAGWEGLSLGDAGGLLGR
ncbi:hypothetical protein BDY17DRAFT_271174 [Neohortaea acidophila]|uniref:Rhodopsin domain-containing protein n=1 Tax=Neohortaea acidophila TaxID=245834 RepID=A0A6A6PJI9_9PEZI|nr:uncharacterized protein BDY17DRAFT_271174 [Neohortaea acidophila]KAF2480162.1 hypothetical protein BDY17DRAFT_271174 [Neohortaea acidophila]